MHRAKARCSSSNPAAKDSSRPTRTARAISEGAMSSGRTPAMSFSASPNAAAVASASPSLSVRSPVLTMGCPERTSSCARARRPSPSDTASISPSSSAAFALALSAVRSIVSAAAGPTSRGNRAVPPAPGLMPSVTSGMRKLARASATRKWQAEASSIALPIIFPATAAATGFAESSTSRNASWKTREIRTASSALSISRKRPTSAPALKWRAPPVMTMPRTESSEFPRRTAARSSSRSARVIVFSGGESSRRTQTPSFTSYATRPAWVLALMSPSRWALIARALVSATQARTRRTSRTPRAPCPRASSA